MDDLDKKVFELFSGRVVPKGATKKSRIVQMFQPLFWNTYWVVTALRMMKGK